MGRPKQFDREEVLGVALDLFWERGYHDTSVRQLAAAMGINVASVYSEFGDKQGLYLAALAKYESEWVPHYIGSLERGGADVGTIERVLRDFASFAESGTAPGCLITNSAIEMAPDSLRSQSALLRYVERLRSAYGNALRNTWGPIDPVEIDELAHSLTATTLGIFVLIRAKVPPAIVAQVVHAATTSLPDRHPEREQQ
jgi:TetR/AcrR family transcriptional regulator, transcriptional repressor for nem operon